MKSFIRRIAFLTMIITAINVNAVLSQETSFRSFGLEGGWYNPSMNYWNQNYPNNFNGVKFKGAMLFGFNLQADLVEPVRVRLGGRYWKEGVTYPTEDISVSIIPIGVDFLVDLTVLKFSIVVPYVGLGATYNFVHLDYTRTDDAGIQYKDKENGKDYTANLIAGFEIPIVSSLFIDLEYRHVWGKYEQIVKDGFQRTTSHNVLLNGPQVSLSFNYALR